MASPFSGSAGRKAAMWTADYLGGVEKNVGSLYDTGLQNSLGALGQARGALGAGLGNQVSSINTGADAALGRLGQIPGLYNPASQAGQQASTAQANFLGLNGIGAASAQDDALRAFRDSTGYRDIVDSATDATARKMSALGMLGSGNTLDAIARIGTQEANKSGQQYLGNLGTLADRGMQANAGIANALTGMAGIDMSRGGALSGVYGQNAAADAGLYGAEAGLYGQDAANRANTAMQVASQIAPAGQQGMLAGQQAAANRFQAGMAGAQLGASLLGGLGGMGGLGGLFGGAGGGFTAPAGGFNQPQFLGQTPGSGGLF
jgi:hypothetical protein